MSDFLLKLNKGKKIYFVSDFHLGAPDHPKSLQREKQIVRWLEQIREDAQAIFFLGDVFDFWFEYKHVVPKGFVRFLGKMAELTDQDIEILQFSGNHDLWLKDYLINEVGIKLFTRPQSVQIGNHQFYLAHGDGLGPGDTKFKFFKKIFTNPACQWLFRWLHPDIGVGLAKRWSSGSRERQVEKELVFQGDKEWLVIHSRQVEEQCHHDYYIYGHRHIAGTYALGGDATYFNLGEWMSVGNYAVYDGDSLELKRIGYED